MKILKKSLIIALAAIASISKAEDVKKYDPIKISQFKNITDEETSEIVYTILSRNQESNKIKIQLSQIEAKEFAETKFLWPAYSMIFRLSEKLTNSGTQAGDKIEHLRVVEFRVIENEKPADIRCTLSLNVISNEIKGNSNLGGCSYIETNHGYSFGNSRSSISLDPL